jgi:hypothetical protein
MTGMLSQRIEKLDHLAGALAQARGQLWSARNLALDLDLRQLDHDLAQEIERLSGRFAAIQEEIRELEQQLSAPSPETGGSVSTEIVTMTKGEWLAEATRRFGPDPIDWRFVCPICGTVASGHDFRAAGANPNALARECIGRYTGARSFEEKPCNYAGYGLFRFSPVRVSMPDGTFVHAFAFADLADLKLPPEPEDP